MGFSNIMDSTAAPRPAAGFARPVASVAARDRTLGRRTGCSASARCAWSGSGTPALRRRRRLLSGRLQQRRLRGGTTPLSGDPAEQLATLSTHRYLHEGHRRLQRTPVGHHAGPDRPGDVHTPDRRSTTLALRVAEMHTGATGVIITADAYHSNTAAVTAISPSIGGATRIRPAYCALPSPRRTAAVSRRRPGGPLQKTGWPRPRLRSEPPASA